jgi:hypothetical protein
MSKEQDILDIAESVLQTARKMTNGSNVHDFNALKGRVCNKISTLQWYLSQKDEIRTERLYKSLLETTNELREMCKHFS